MPTKASDNTIRLCKLLSTSQIELLNLMVEIFDDRLVQIINVETRSRATPINLRRWLKNNTQNDRRIIGDGIKAIRLQAGLTQRQLAERIGCAHWNISDIESGKRMPRKKLQAIAVVLKDDALTRMVERTFVQ